MENNNYKIISEGKHIFVVLLNFGMQTKNVFLSHAYCWISLMHTTKFGIDLRLKHLIPLYLQLSPSVELLANTNIAFLSLQQHAFSFNYPKFWHVSLT